MFHTMDTRRSRLTGILAVLMLALTLAAAGTIGAPTPKIPNDTNASDRNSILPPYQNSILPSHQESILPSHQESILPRITPAVEKNSPFHTRLVFLGTTGGVSWWPGSDRASSSSALVVGDTIYLIDMGQGSASRLAEAFNTGDFVTYNGSRIENGSSVFLDNARALFITHLHMDHTADYPSLLLIGPGAGLGTSVTATGQTVITPFQVFGPASRGPLEADKCSYLVRNGTIFTVDSANPALEITTPGIRQMTNNIFEAYSQDINDMTLDNGYRDWAKLVEVHEIGVNPGAPGDIRIPAAVPDPNNDTCPAMDPFEVYKDDNVRVTAILVDHHQVFPALAYRFDTADGSVVFSGDTGNNTKGNLQKLAHGADILVHEVIDPAWIDLKFGNVTNGSQMAALKTHMLQSHTPIMDAGTVATDCHVKTLVLNHIVPGNTPREHLLQAQKTFSGRVIIGEDLMVIPVGRAEGWGLV
jgi:ribonuclease BN (tRNA processing enzyme)